MDRTLLGWLSVAHPPEKMLFLAGARQVGKTTIAHEALRRHARGGVYLNWDVSNDRRRILAQEDLFSEVRPGRGRPLVVFDELHKMRKFKGWLKGFYDENRDAAAIWVTGSGRLDLYQKGGDSLIGRYFLYRMHPLSAGEIGGMAPLKALPEPNKAWERFDQGDLASVEIGSLLQYGGFPEPFLNQRSTFHKRWLRSRRERVAREEVRDLTRISDLDRLEYLTELLNPRVASPLSLNALAGDLGVAFETVRSWISTLERVYYVFGIRPWARRIQRSIRKERKIYFWDWSEVREPAARFENFVISHLLKACHSWTDFGFGDYDLWYVRDKEKREVDALITKDREPWLLAEVKRNETVPSPSLVRTAEALRCPRLLQIVESERIRKRVRTRSGICNVVSASEFLAALP